MTDEQFRALLERVDAEELHALGLAAYDAGYSDGADTITTAQTALEPQLARFIQQIAIEHGACQATQQRREAPIWLQELQGLGE